MEPNNKSADRQQLIDFTRGQELAMLRNARLPSVMVQEGKTKRTIKPDAMKHLLRQIDDHGRRSFASLATLAAETQIGLRGVNRIVKALLKLSLICVSKRPKAGGGFVNEYTIVWTELALLCPGDTLTLHSAPPAHNAQPTDHHAQLDQHRAQMADHRAQVDQHRAQVGTRSAQEPPIGNAHGNENDDGGDDDGEFSFLKDRSEKIFKRFPGGDDPLVRERVLRMFKLEYRGTIAAGTCKDVVRELAAIQKRGKFKDVRAVLYRLLLNRGYDLDKLIVDVPESLIFPPKRIQAAKEAEARQTAEEPAAAANAERERNEDRELRYGPAVDALDADGLQQLAPYIEEFTRDYMRRHRHKPGEPWPFVVRIGLMRAMEQRDAQPASVARCTQTKTLDDVGDGT